MTGQNITVFVVKHLVFVLIIYIAAIPLVYLVVRALAAVSRQISRSRAQKRTSVVAEYEPPDGMMPWELGYLVDRRFGDNELQSAVLYMAQQGVLRLGALEGDWQITVVDASKAADNVQQTLVTYISDDTRLSQLVSRLSEQEGVQASFEAAVVGELASKGYLNASAWSVFDNLENGAAFLMTMVLFGTTIVSPLIWAFSVSHQPGAIVGFDGLDNISVNLIFLPLYFGLWKLVRAYAQLLSYVYFRAAGLPLGATRQLRRRQSDIYGYQLYLQIVEVPKLEVRYAMRAKSAPYAIALCK